MPAAFTSGEVNVGGRPAQFRCHDVRKLGVGGQEGIRSEDNHDGGVSACARPA